MPRVITSDNDCLDFCFKCFPSKLVSFQRFGNNGDGPDNRGNCFSWDDLCPQYDGEGYECYACGKTLKDRDHENRHERSSNAPTKERDVVAESIAADRRILPGCVVPLDFM